MTDIDIGKAVLHSPEGEFKFKRDKKYPTWFLAHDNPHSVKISLFPKKGISILMFWTEDVSINHDKAYYQLNDGKKIKLIMKRNKHAHKEFDIISPESMDYYWSNGSGLHLGGKKLTLKHKIKIKFETYHYYIPFTIDNRDYAIDVTFNLDIDSKLHIGAPGMP